MIKIFLPLIFILGLLSCKPLTESTDYFGQIYPDSIPVVFAPGKISLTGRLEHGISFTPDTKELTFGILNKDDFSGEIYYSNKINNNWTEPIIFEPLKEECVFLPYFSPNGKSMLYAKSRPDTNNGFTDIWMLKKKNNIWNNPVKIKSPISTLTRESSACLTFDNTIYFSSNRDGNGLADLYTSSLNEGEYLDVERLDSISSPRDEESIFVSSEESYIIFSRYATNENGPDLFISYRDCNGTWLQPTRLNSTINSSAWERRPFVSIDNKYLFFTRMTFNQTSIEESDIYWVNTNKVFKPFVFNSIDKQTIKVGKETEIAIPIDYFKDINNEELEISFNQENFEWVEFDSDKMTLKMNPREIGEFDLLFSAVDSYSNLTEDNIKIIVKE